MLESLRSLPDHDILANADRIVVQDRKLTLRLLVHLNEIERRGLYLKCGFSSMFVYCTSHLKLSEPGAARRLRSARCLVRCPELHGLLESGEVNLSTVSMVAKYLKGENAAAIVSRIRGRSRREVESLVAELEPRAALPPDRVRTVVVRAAPISVAASPRCTVAGDSEKSPTAQSASEEERRAGDHPESPGATVGPTLVPGAARLERRALVQFSAGEVVINKLEHVRSIASHRLAANAPLEQVIEFLSDYFTEREDPTRRHERREERKQSRKSGPATEIATTEGRQPRRVSMAVRDQIFVRDMNRCTYVASNGKQCGSTHVLQVDHIQPVARGGANEPNNLRLLCAFHNRLEAERLMGCGRRLAQPHR